MAGAVIWSGPSLLDGAPIVVIATGLGRERSRNPKTGPMIQTWILLAEVEPHIAAKTGENESICGDCPLIEVCYVNTFQAPLRVYRTWKAGKYPALDPADVGAGERVRVGSYGDPGAVPAEVWRRLLSRAHRKRTGYSHQWRRGDQGLREFCMASIDSERSCGVKAKAEANEAGWRTFRVVDSVDDVLPDEILCPASKEAGFVTTCHRCGLCAGRSTPTAPNIAIVQH